MPSTIANGFTIYLDLKGVSVGTVDNLRKLCITPQKSCKKFEVAIKYAA
jgi:hypothetical protein